MALAACGGSDPPDAAPAASLRAPNEGAAAPAARRPRGVRENCSTRSEATFPGAYSNPRNVVVGPFVLVGATQTDAETVRAVGGNKFPALLRARHRVTVELPRRVRRHAGLAYGPLPQGVITRDAAHRVVTFAACRSGPPTFWSGGVVVDSPRCVPLRVWVDRETAPRRVVLPMGVRDCD
jgi:hypothetical protein